MEEEAFSYDESDIVDEKEYEGIFVNNIIAYFANKIKSLVLFY